jgi:hypothetical protein
MLTVSIPLRTARGMNGSHGHWSTDAKRRKKERHTTHLFLRARDPGKGLIECGSLQITITRVGPTNGLDSDNLQGALKSVRDGIADWLGINDNDKRVQWIYGERREKNWSVHVQLCQGALGSS